MNYKSRTKSIAQQARRTARLSVMAASTALVFSSVTPGTFHGVAFAQNTNATIRGQVLDPSRRADPWRPRTHRQPGHRREPSSTAPAIRPAPSSPPRSSPAAIA